MRVLIDGCVDWCLLRGLPGHDVKTVRQMGWDETVNDALLRLAEQQFDVLVTTDKNLSFQQNVVSFNLGVVVLRARSARWCIFGRITGSRSASAVTPPRWR